MSNFKVYHKRGATNYKEKKMVTAIEKELGILFEKNPDLASTFKPAKNYEELKALHDKYCVEDAVYTETKNEENATSHEEFRKALEKTIEPPKKEETSTFGDFLDPFNDAEPIVRDYVMDDKKLLSEPENENNVNTSQTFEEPKDDKMAFELPNSDDEGGKSKRSANNNRGGEAKASKPMNPSFNEMDGAKKKRSTKRFAKMIVEATCILAERGCIWWTTKDITEDKLAQYELEGQMDLQILLTLENNQQATVRQWLGAKVQEAQTLYKVSDEDKNDLIDSLYEVMLEKGIAPTPMQELIINSVKTFVIDMGVKAFMFNQQIKSVLTQLRDMKRQEDEALYNTATEEDAGGVVDNPAVSETEQIVE